MKLGVISQNLMEFNFEEGLKFAHTSGFQAIETGGIGLWGNAYCNVEKLLAGGKDEVQKWLDSFTKYDLEISALGGHGSPLLPDKNVKEKYSKQFRDQCKLAEMAGINKMTLLAGLPEGAEGDTAPNWVTFAEWPFLRDTLEWQWENRLTLLA